MRKTAEVEVETTEGRTKCTLLAMGGIDAGLMSIELSNVFGPAILGVVTSMQSNDGEAVMRAVGSLTEKLGEAKFRQMKDKLLRGGQCVYKGQFVDLRDDVIDDIFSGHPGSLFRLLFEALKLNFASFMGDLGVKMASLTALQVAKK